MYRAAARLTGLLLSLVISHTHATPLGLPPVPIPEDNPQTPAKIKLGERLFHDARFSSDGTVSCATCHAPDKAFTDNKPVSTGVNGLTGTRNAPTVINSAYMKTLFWDGREPDLEGQSKQPFINPVEGGLPNHQPILEVIRKDPEYQKAFKEVFGVKPEQVTIDHVAKAIASFERTVVMGDTPFDRWRYGGEDDVLTEQQKRGFRIFVDKGRCVSCHRVEQTQALFIDNRFHNIGVGFKRIRGKEADIARSFIKAKQRGADVDKTVLTQKDASELGRFAVTEDLTEVGAFKTPTLRNIELTAPYMHDGSLATLEEVVDFYNNGGKLKPEDPSSPFLSGGIRPLNLSKQEKRDLVEFLKSLTSPQAKALAETKKMADRR